VGHRAGRDAVASISNYLLQAVIEMYKNNFTIITLNDSEIDCQNVDQGV